MVGLSWLLQGGSLERPDLFLSQFPLFPSFSLSLFFFFFFFSQSTCKLHPSLISPSAAVQRLLRQRDQDFRQHSIANTHTHHPYTSKMMPSTSKLATATATAFLLLTSQLVPAVRAGEMDVGNGFIPKGALPNNGAWKRTKDKVFSLQTNWKGERVAWQGSKRGSGGRLQAASCYFPPKTLMADLEETSHVNLPHAPLSLAPPHLIPPPSTTSPQARTSKTGGPSSTGPIPPTGWSTISRNKTPSATDSSTLIATG